jgi:hypothetical protein
LGYLINTIGITSGETGKKILNVEISSFKIITFGVILLALGIAAEIFFGQSQKNWSGKPGKSEGVATPNKESESGE